MKIIIECEAVLNRVTKHFSLMLFSQKLDLFVRNASIRNLRESSGQGKGSPVLVFFVKSCLLLVEA